MKRKPPAVKANVEASPKSITRADNAASPDEDERASSHSTTIANGRASQTETTNAVERASDATKPEGPKRAGSTETAKRKKRATPDATPNISPPSDPPSFVQTQYALRRYVENFYDIQEMRLATGGRTAKKGKDAEIILHEYDIERLESQKDALLVAEKLALKDVELCLDRIPFYQQVLSDKKLYKGIGPTMAGVILSSFDIAKEDTVSKMWAFAGLRPLDCKRCKHCHAIVEEDEDAKALLYLHPKIDKIKCVTKGRTLSIDDVYSSGKAQRPQKGVKLNFNKWLRTKLVGVLGPVILKMSTYKCVICKAAVKNVKDKGQPTEFYVHREDSVSVDRCALLTSQMRQDQLFREDAPFRKFYDHYKKRKEEAKWGMNDGHRHNAAIRFMIKQLLLDIHTKWRRFEGLSVRPSYQEQYLGHTHVGTVEDHMEKSQRLVGTQKENASQRVHDNQKVDAGQSSEDNQNMDASLIEASLEEEVALAGGE